MKYIITVILSITAVVSYALPTAEQADSAYNKESYRDAIKLYSEAIASDGATSDLYYNIGNAYYRDNQLGKAVVSYERALAINPSNQEARINLDFVKTRIEDAPEDDSSFLYNLHLKVVSLITPNAWAVLALLSFIMLIGAVALYIFSSDVTLRKVGFFSAIVFCFIFGYIFAISYQTANAGRNHNEAVVIVPTTTLSSAPRSSRNEKEKVVPIHEGTKVLIIDSLSTPDDLHVGRWYDVKINNSSRGWLNAADVERI